jgi:hypothetical protein
MVVAVAVGVGCVLVLVALAGVLRYVRRPVLEPLDPASVALPREPAPQQIKILRSAEELDAAIERASTTPTSLRTSASHPWHSPTRPSTRGSCSSTPTCEPRRRSMSS